MSPSLNGSDLSQATLACVVQDASQIAEVRRLASSLAVRCGFDETQVGKITIIVTELATNLFKHAGGGQIILQPSATDSFPMLEIFALDRGPGMRDPQRCLTDGFSTAGSPGTGLGAVRRLSGAFEIYTAEGAGCAILSRNWRGMAATRPSASWRIGALCVPKAGEPICGDAWAVVHTADSLVLMMADGLGHGPIAAMAAHEAVRVFRAGAHLEPVLTMQRIHEALRSTRGAAVAICKIDLKTREVRFVGLGNISAGFVTDGQTRNMVSHNGTAGMEARKIQEFNYVWPAGALVVLHSDGIATHWRLSSWPGLAQRDPSLIAAVLYQHFQRGRDDATVVVLSECGLSAP